MVSSVIALMIVWPVSGAGPDLTPIHPPDTSPIVGRILRPGLYHGSEVSVREGARWLGLFRNSNGYSLGMASIRVRLAEDPVSAERTAKLVSVHGDGQPVFLFDGLRQRHGKFAVTVFDGDAYLRGDRPFLLRLGGGSAVSIGAAPNGQFYREGNEKPVPIHQVYIEKDDARQVLPLQLSEAAGAVRLLWAGDMDGDGRLDLLFDETGYNWTALRLFLSSAAKIGELVAEAGFHYSTGC